ncbi:ChaN family lipoprotein [Pseudochelatococcus contaminans]|uniref:Putative iron-regulated protein n=1 Tax=Pseudochelatococcus contaminans TaxID=1538103 RepID=A0A7W6EHT8_9HYPH|nr:putative iron-regulated protein [Pseudochelatococcus contaminans]
MSTQPTDTPTDVPHERGRWLDPTTGNTVDQQALMRALAGRQAVLLGERHDIAEIHRWQLHVTTYLHGLRPNLAVGFEMFPRRLQPVLDRWVAGEYDTATFIEDSEWHQVWGFDPAIYLPLFHFCRQQRVPMLALNCRRALVTEVGQQGWEAIAEADRDGVTPAAPALDAYREYLFSITRGPPTRKATSAHDPAYDRFIRAQQTWDRAFACNIANAIRSAEAEGREPPLVVGIIGRGHLEYGYGTPYQLHDLGIEDVAVLLPNDRETLTIEPHRRIAEAVFRLDTPEPPAERGERPRPAANPDAGTGAG